MKNSNPAHLQSWAYSQFEVPAKSYAQLRKERRQIFCRQLFWFFAFIAATAALIALLAGCKTADGEAPPRNYASIAKVAMWIGTVKYLQAHPEQRPAFEIARTQLRTLSTSTNFEPASVITILQGLPTDAFDSGDGALYLSGAIILWDELGGSSTRLENPEVIQRTAVAMVEGLDLALGPAARIGGIPAAAFAKQLNDGGRKAADPNPCLWLN